MKETRTPMPETDIKFITSERMVINILISTGIGLAIIAIAVGIAGDNPIIVGILSIATVIDIVGMVLVSRGISLPGRILVPAILSVASGYIAYSRGGLYHIAMLGFPFIIVLSGLLLGTRGVFIFAAITSMASIFIGYADINGLSPFSESSRTGYDDIAVVVTLLFFIAVVLRVIINLLTKSVQEAEEYGKTQEASNIELKNLQNDLEKRVEERTKELKGRTDQLQTVSEVARSVITIQDTDELLPAITRLVSERFGFYHVGIFLVDDDREYAALQAANSEGGQRMLERQHKLRLDTNSIVGFVSSRGEPRIALDVGVDSVFFDNPDLPDTRSEMALPLRVGGRVIGVLDVQSIEPNAFTEADVITLSTLTDQVAIAIENAHLFGEARKALKESKDTFSRYVKREWSSFTSRTKSTGYLFDGNRTIPLEAKDKRKKIRSLPQTGRLVLEKDTRELTIPIRLRGEVIGYLDVKPKNIKRKWTQDDMILLEAAAERAALALENARLVESSQQRASRERTIGEISTRIGAVSDLDAIMQAAVEELGRKISGAAEVTLELGTEQDKS
jgi:GAF domain-containing protein